MDPKHWQQVKDLFDRAAALPVHERRAFVEAETGDAALATEVLSLLDADADARTRFLDAGPLAEAAEFTGWVGREFGPYVATEELGRGGMGVVLLGERADGRYRGRVAIKVVQTSLMAEGLRERFRTEGQILAELSHPNVARLYDAGDTPEGLSWLIMEYVDGPRLDVYADEALMDVPSRLRLFRQVLDGVDYAHARGVVHRDLKPSNILVAQDGTPKLVDFGIAKLLETRASTEATVALTRTAYRMMTPEYASPEQVRGLPVSASSDVYSLGVVLYRLLTGRAPYRLATTRPGDVERVICEESPTRPSDALTRALATGELPTEAAPTHPDVLARNRASTLDRLQKTLRGDLDTIVLTALGKEPSQRYATAGAFADDVDRYLTGEPIRARPPTLLYRTTRFVRRRWVALVASIAILSGLGAAAWQGLEARAQRAAAQNNSDELLALATSVVNTFNLAEREAAAGDTETREAAVSAALASLNQLVDRVEGPPSPELLYELSAAYREVAMVQGYPFMANLGRTEDAFENMRQAASLVRRITEEHPDFAHAWSALGQQLTIIGDLHASSSRPDSAFLLYQQGLEILEERLEAEPEDLPALDGLAATAQRIGSWLVNNRRLDEAEQYMRRAMAAEERYVQVTDRGDRLSARRDVASVGSNLAAILAMKGDLRGALEVDGRTFVALDSVLATGATPASRQFEAAFLMNHALRLIQDGQLRPADSVSRVALAKSRERVAEDPSNVQASESLVIALGYRGRILWEIGRPDEVVALAREALGIIKPMTEASFARAAATQVYVHRLLGEGLTDQGNFDAALSEYDEGLALLRRYLEAFPAANTQTLAELAWQHRVRARLHLVRAAQGAGAEQCDLARAAADSTRRVDESLQEAGWGSPAELEIVAHYATFMRLDACGMSPF